MSDHPRAFPRDLPKTGGSHIRDGDGKLRRAGETAEPGAVGKKPRTAAKKGKAAAVEAPVEALGEAAAVAPVKET